MKSLRIRRRHPLVVQRWLLLTVCLFCSVFSRRECAAKAPEQSTRKGGPGLSIRAEDVKKHIVFLASPPLRGRSGEDAVLAANYVKCAFIDAGLRPLFAHASYLQPIPGSDGKGGTRQLGRNVGGWVPGSDPECRDEFVIISAHYDHLGVRNGQVYPGADDNASGVAMLLEVARKIAALKKKPRRSFVFLAFDLEERMLLGSRWFVAHPPWPIKQVKLFITADLIGRTLGNLPLASVFVLGSEHSHALRQLVGTAQPPNGLEVARLAIDMVGTRSDYGPFRDRKIPFLFFSTGQHPDYHTPRDVPDRVDFGKVANVSNLVYQLSVRAANAKSAPDWTDEPSPDLEDARTLFHITTLLLRKERKKNLTPLQVLLVSQTHDKAKEVLEHGKMTRTDHKWLTHAAQLMLLSVF